LSEVARVLRPGALLYVSEPVYQGSFNDVIRLFNDEGVVRAAAQAAVDAALGSGPWVEVANLRFEMPVQYIDFADFERRMMHNTYSDHRVDEDLRTRVQAAFEPHCRPEGARFVRLMHARLLRRSSAPA
jgi:hypothetical protein